MVDGRRWCTTAFVFIIVVCYERSPRTRTTEVDAETEVNREVSNPFLWLCWITLPVRGTVHTVASSFMIGIGNWPSRWYGRQWQHPSSRWRWWMNESFICCDGWYNSIFNTICKKVKMRRDDLWTWTVSNQAFHHLSNHHVARSNRVFGVTVRDVKS